MKIVTCIVGWEERVEFEIRCEYCGKSGSISPRVVEEVRATINYERCRFCEMTSVDIKEVENPVI